MTPELRERLERVVHDVVRPQAESVDAEGRFPGESVEALGAAGLLGLVSAPEVGGQGQGPAAAVEVIARLARECGSTAMVTCMHYAGTVVAERCGSAEVRRQLADGRALTTLAFSEAGSRSHFWAPLSTATRVAEGVRLDASKSWVTSAHHATWYVWSSRPLAAEGASTLWLVPRTAPGLTTPGAYRGLGLRGNDSTPVRAEGVVVREDARLGPDGGGLDLMLGVVLPWFNLMNAACSLGLMEAACERAAAHARGSRYAHLEQQSLAELPTIRAYLARMRVQTDQVGALLRDAAGAVAEGRPEAQLRVLESKAAAGEAALGVLSTGMRVCGGAAYRREVGLERAFRDGQAASVMAPTTDQLYDFIGKALCGLPVF